MLVMTSNTAQIVTWRCVPGGDCSLEVASQAYLHVAHSRQSRVCATARNLKTASDFNYYLYSFSNR